METGYPIDAWREAFRRFLQEGMTVLEASCQFSRLELNRAVSQEIREHRCWIDPETGEVATHDGLPALLSYCCEALREASEEADLEQAIELWGAGWTSEEPPGHQNTPLMALYWRRPAKAKARPGRLFKSTNQAFQALQRGGRR